MVQNLKRTRTENSGPRKVRYQAEIACHIITSSQKLQDPPEELQLDIIDDEASVGDDDDASVCAYIPLTKKITFPYRPFEQCQLVFNT
jgi:hypothetical protein